jgi:hypothetical protein
MTIAGDTIQSLLLKDKDIHLLNILKLNTFHILFFLVQEMSNASTDLIEIINTTQCEIFWLNTGMDKDQQHDASDMIN